MLCSKCGRDINIKTDFITGKSEYGTIIHNSDCNRSTVELLEEHYQEYIREYLTNYFDEYYKEKK